MSAPNFGRMNYEGIPMICGKPYGCLIREYLEETGENIEDFDEIDADDYGWPAQDEYDRAQEIAEAFSESLNYFKVTVEAGYYEGFMFNVESVNDFDYDEIDNDDAQYYFGKCRSRVQRDSAAELRKISKWLHGLTGRGFVEVICTARFSNGEAHYSIVSPRAELTAAAIA